ncbi:MAG: glycosyltransferase family protein [Dehalococcoidia bacterium]
MKRLLIYSQGPSLGHLRRARNIALEVLAHEPDCSVLILADTPATPMFPPVPGVDHLKLPTIIRTEGGAWESTTLNVGIDRIISLRSQIILQAYTQFNPEAILIHDRPLGVLEELKPLLNHALRQTRPPKLFLGICGLLDLPELTEQKWTELSALDYLRAYDAILVYDSHEMRDVDSDQSLSPFANKVYHCNYVATGDKLPAADPVDRDPYLLVMGGAGHTAFHLAETFVEALPHIRQDLSHNAVVLTGPSMHPEHRQKIMDRSAGFPVQVLHGVDDATPLIQQAEAIVTLAGYNSLCEILQQRKKALVLPRQGPNAEQQLRAKMLAERRLVMTIPPADLTPFSLAQELVRLVRSEGIPDPMNLPPLDGAQRTAAVLLGGPIPREHPAVPVLSS